jgi:RimJ/RimL family protein N-acetyltransferase
MVVLETDRLNLRPWQPSDREPFAQINADPRVMECMPAPLSEEESNLLADRIEDHFRAHGFGLYAAELRSTHEFLGFIGLSIPSFRAAFTPCVEIGWRLSAGHWNRGLATEGAKAIVRRAFETLQLESLVSFTIPSNMRSRRVMEKLGMTRDPAEDFEHPGLPKGHPMCRHVLYRLHRRDF